MNSDTEWQLFCPPCGRTTYGYINTNTWRCSLCNHEIPIDTEGDL